jgi:hypothetical protein
MAGKRDGETMVVLWSDGRVVKRKRGFEINQIGL